MLVPSKIEQSCFIIRFARFSDRVTLKRIFFVFIIMIKVIFISRLQRLLPELFSIVVFLEKKQKTMKYIVKIEHFSN